MGTKDTEEATEPRHKCLDIDFGCSACHSLLGYVDKDTRSKIRIKYRDMYVRIADAKLVEITCRYCGEINALRGGV